MEQSIEEIKQEIKREIKKEIKEIVEQKQYIEGIRQILEKSQNIIKILVYERNKIQDENSSKYKLLCFKIKIEEQQRKVIYKEWETKTEQLKEKISKIKEKFLKQIEDKRYLIYNNIIFGDVNIEDIKKANILELQQKKEELEIKINLAQISDEDIKNEHQEEQEDIYEARINLTHNKEILKNIDKIIQLHILIGQEDVMDILRKLQKFGKQVEEEFDIQLIQKIKDEENKQEDSHKPKDETDSQQTKQETEKENIEKINQLQKEWEKWRDYYDKCYKIKEVNDDIETSRFLKSAQEVLKRKMKRTQEEYYIKKHKLNSEKIQGIKTNDERDIKERIANVSMADITYVNEKAKIELEKEKDLYESDDKFLCEIIIKLDALYKLYKEKIANKEESKKETKISVSMKAENKKEEFRKKYDYNMTKSDLENIKSLSELWINKLNETGENEEENFKQ